MKRRNIVIISSIALILLVVWIFSGSDAESQGDVKVKVKQGRFEVTITTTGELEAKKSEDIKGPEGLRQVGIYRVAITDLVPEGTVVKEGDYIDLRAITKGKGYQGPVKRFGIGLKSHKSEKGRRAPWPWSSRKRHARWAPPVRAGNRARPGCRC